jgi:hypothetical protein
MSDHCYELRSYLWKGEPFLAMYCDGRRLGQLAVATDVSADMARRLGPDWSSWARYATSRP